MAPTAFPKKSMGLLVAMLSVISTTTLLELKEK
jgi:hypothetical protein